MHFAHIHNILGWILCISYKKIILDLVCELCIHIFLLIGKKMEICNIKKAFCIDRASFLHVNIGIC